MRGGSAVTGRRFVGIGVDECDAEPLRTLTHAVSDVTQLHELLAAQGFEGQPLENPTEVEARQFLRGLRSSLSGGALVVVWSGHGKASEADYLRLLGRDSSMSSQAEGLGAGEVAALGAESGANQLLFVIDTCYSGQAAAIAAAAGRMLLGRPTEGGPTWVGVLASCLSVAEARDGLLGEQLRRVVRYGPETPELRVRWAPQIPSVSGYEVCDAVLKDWERKDVQRPQLRTDGSAWFMFNNPLYDPGAPQRVVEHLLLAARGGARDEGRSLFTGRTAEVNVVVEWVRSGRPGVRVLTGSAGTGKSAIAGRVVSLANAGERARLLDGEDALAHEDPGEGSVHAHVHARGLTSDRMAQLLDGQLVASGILGPGGGGQEARRNAAELVGTLQRRAESGGTTPVIVVDGLDEARGEAFSIGEDLLLRLQPFAQVIVSTREVRSPQEGKPSLVMTLAPEGPDLDLDNPEVQARGQRDMAGYLETRLSGVDGRMDGAVVADYVAQTALSSDNQPFLLSRVLADQLSAVPVDTSMIDWQDRISLSVTSALDADLARVSLPVHRQISDTISAPALGRKLLEALTWGLGAGLPEEEWLVVANTITGGTECTREDISWAFAQLGRYIVQDAEGGVAVYRIAHQTLADHLHPVFRPSAELPFDPAALPISLALLDRYRVLLDCGLPAEAPVYLWRYVWLHAARAGTVGIAMLRELVQVEPLLRPELGWAETQLSETFAFWGRQVEALPFAEDAQEIYRALAQDNPAFLPELAMALHNVGNRYSRVGRRADAVTPTEEAVTLRRTLTQENPAFLPNLAMTLNNLGNRYSEVGRRTDAVTPTEEAQEIYRTLAQENHAFLPELASTLNNLGNRYSGVGRRTDALAPTEEAVTLRRTLTQENPAFLPDLASALNNLGIFYNGVGRRTDALAPTEEAQEIYRTLAQENPAFLPELASTLNNLGNRYSEVGRHTDAVTPTEEAVTLRRTLTQENPAFLPDLASALNNLGNHYSEVDRHADALTLTEEAQEIYRTLAQDNPAFLPDLAMALNNLGACYSEVGRRADAVTSTEEAVTLRRTLTQENPAFLPNLATTLDNLGAYYSEVGRSSSADEAWESAIAAMDPAGAVLLLLARMDYAMAGDLATIDWLVRALQTADTHQSAAMIGALHDSARSHRAPNPDAFDAAWTERTGEPAPTWLHIDPDLYTTAQSWITTPTFHKEHEHLTQHPELLAPGADLAVEEALRSVNDEEAKRYQDLRAAARADGIDSAYQPIFAAIVADDFIEADPAEQRSMLEHDNAQLLSDAARDAVRNVASSDTDQATAAVRADSLLSLAAFGESDRVFETIENPARLPELLQELAERAATTALGPAAVVASTIATTRAEAATAWFYYALHLATIGEDDRARQFIQDAADLDPTSVNTWITRLATLAAANPAVLPLIQTLATHKTPNHDPNNHEESSNASD